MNEISKKKTAYHFQIRRQWINNYFRERRKGLWEGGSIEQVRPSQLEQETLTPIFNNLPQSILELNAKVTDSPQCMSLLLLKKLDELSERMIDCNVVEWDHYVYVVNSMLQALSQQKDIQTVIEATLSTILHSGSKHIGKQSALQTTIQIPVRKLCGSILQHILYLRENINMANQLDIRIISEVVIKAIEAFHTQITNGRLQDILWVDEITRPLLVINQIITMSSFDKETGLKSKNLYSEELMKIKFAEMTLFKDVRVLKLIINIGYKSQSPVVLESILKILVNLTHTLSNPCYYSALLDLGILTFISFVLSLHGADKQAQMISILTVRLLNNIMVTSTQITGQQLKQFNFGQLLEFHRNHTHQHELSLEIVELVSNLFNFMSQNSEGIGYLINANVHSVLLWGLGQQQFLPAESKAQLLAALLGAIESCPSQIKNELTSYFGELEQMADPRNDSTIEGIACSIIDLINKAQL